MSVFYSGEIVIYSLSFNDFMPFNVNADVLAKVRKNFFEHNKRQCDKLVQNINDISLKYSYNMEKGRPMKWLVQRNKKTIEQALPDNTGGYEISTFDENGTKLITSYFNAGHFLVRSSFVQGGKNVTADVKVSGEKAVINYTIGDKTEELILFQTDSDFELNERLKNKNPFITVTALTNIGLVYFGTQNEIERLQSIIAEIKAQIKEEKKPKVYITDKDRESGFNFKDSDFNIRKNMNTTFDLTKADLFEGDITEDEQKLIDEKQLESMPPKEEVFSNDESFEEPLKDNFKQEIISEDKQADNTEKSDSPDIESIIDTILKGKHSDAEGKIKKDGEPVENKTETQLPEQKSSSENIKESISPQVTMDNPEPEPKDTSPEIRQQNPDAVAPDLIINSVGERYLYFGEVSEELAREGYGRTQMQNGRTAYEGEYHKNKRNGFGSFYFRDGGLCYSGEWKENKRSGFGMGVRSSDGSYHVGEWSDNKPNGVGARFDKYGRLSYVSNFKNGRESGLCVEYGQDGSITIFKWINDEKKIIQTIFP